LVQPARLGHRFGKSGRRGHVAGAAEELENAFAELAADGKARSICVPKADGTIERRWSFTSKGTPLPQRRETRDSN